MSAARASIIELVVIVAICACGTSAQAAAVYVQAGATGDGSSWASPLGDLHEALDLAEASGGVIDEIHVAEGTYIPTRMTEPHVPWSATYLMVSGVSLYGGYPPGGGDRDPTSHPTILSGSDKDWINNVTMLRDLAAPAVMDGFTIRTGRAHYNPSYGGGIWCINSDLVLRHCTIEDCQAGLTGGGVYFEGGELEIISCRFIDNSTLDSAAGCSFYGSRLVIHDTLFESNGASAIVGGLLCHGDDTTEVVITECVFRGNGGEQGAAISARNGHFNCSDCLFEENRDGYSGYSAVRVNNTISRFDRCTFRANYGRCYGFNGGALVSLNSVTAVHDSLFVDNRSETAVGTNYGSSIVAKWPDSDLRVVNCTFLGNESVDGGAAIACLDGTLTVANSVLWDNTADIGTVEMAQLFAENASSTITHSCIQGLDQHAGSGNIGLSPVFANNGGRLTQLSPCVDAGDNTYVDTDADLDGNPRRADDPTRSDTGFGDPPIVDMGAYEFIYGTPALVSAFARRQHGPAATFDLPIALAGTPSVDPRTGPAKLILSFDHVMEAADGSVDCGEEVVLAGGVCQDTDLQDQTLTIDATLDENSCVTVSLAGIRRVGGGPDVAGVTDVSLIAHPGNVNGDTTVNVLDLQTIKNHLFQPLDAMNYIYDVVCDGTINTLDLQETMNHVFEPLPPCDE